MTADEQIDALRKMADRGVAVWCTRAFFSLAIGLFIAGLVSRHPAWFAIGIFVSVAALSARQTTPQILRAARALDAGEKSQTIVRISLTEWSDSVSYHAVVQGAAGDSWAFDFIPLDWRPVEGSCEATAYHLPEIAWPVLLQLEQGIIYPRSQPTKAMAS